MMHNYAISLQFRDTCFFFFQVQRLLDACPCNFLYWRKCETYARGRNSLEESSFSKGLSVYFQIARPAKGINVGAKTARPCHFPARLPPTEKVTMSSRLYVLHMRTDPAAREIYRVSRWIVITVANRRNPGVEFQPAWNFRKTKWDSPRGDTVSRVM